MIDCLGNDIKVGDYIINKHYQIYRIISLHETKDKVGYAYAYGSSRSTTHIPVLTTGNITLLSEEEITFYKLKYALC